MNATLFNTATESYQVSHIAYAGPVSEIPEDRRKNGHTHAFKMVGTRGTVYCNYRSEESAKKAHGLLLAMMSANKPAAFRHGFELVDPAKVVSLSRVIQFKEPQGELTHAFVVTIDTADEKNGRVWLRYRSEDSANKARRALFAAIHAANKQLAPEEEPAEGESEGDGLPF